VKATIRKRGDQSLRPEVFLRPGARTKIAGGCHKDTYNGTKLQADAGVYAELEGEVGRPAICPTISLDAYWRTLATSEEHLEQRTRV